MEPVNFSESTIYLYIYNSPWQKLMFESIISAIIGCNIFRNSSAV